MDKKKLLIEFKRLAGLELNEEENKPLFDFKSLPKDIQDTLDEYDKYTMKFDWNAMQDKLGKNFQDWFDKHTNEMFIKHIDDIIRETTQDMILLKKKGMAEMKLQAFEELIKPTLGNSVLVPALSKFEERVIMNPYVTPQEIQQAFQDAKNIIDDSGSINQSKIEQSEIFKGGDINLPRFESFVKDNPEYKGVFNDWKKLFDEYMELFLTELHAYRNSTPIDRIRKLRNTLINIKKTKL